MTARQNPLLADWDTPFGVPPFAALRTDDFPDAFAAALEAHAEEIAAIANDPAPATFSNTLVALERAGQLLNRVARTFFTLASANTSPELQAIQRDIAPKLAAHADSITSNPQLYARLTAVVKAHADETAPLSGEDLRLLERVQQAFKAAGAHLDDAGKARHRAIKLRLAELATAFSQNVLADEAEWVMDLDGESDLAGLPDDLVSAASQIARDRGRPASHAITLARSIVEPFITYSARADLREKAFDAWVRRGANGNGADNRAIIAEILALRTERAQLLGYDTYADFSLVDTMAKTPVRVRELLDGVWVAARARALEEAQALGEAARSDGLNGPLKAADWRFYAEKVRRARYNLGDEETKPYFPLEQVIAAAFHTANRLFGVKFEPVHGLPLYHDDLRAWDVRDADDQHVGLFIGDYFARSNKQSGAWMNALRDQSRVDGDVRPIILNTCNFAKAAGGAPTLLSLDDARTLFHEFGHGLHGLLSDVTYPTLSGTHVSRDFVELPSQLYEQWLMSDEVLAEFARHAQTGAPMPRDLIEKLRAAETFNQGFKTVEYLASAIVDMELHARQAKADDDVVALQDAVLRGIGMPDAVVMRHATPHFQHLFAGDGYAAGYYSYMWSEVLDADAYRAFEETGDVFDAETAERLKTFIYSAGGKRDEEAAYIAFRGQLPTVDGLLAKRGLIARDQGNPES